jgi:hypothetical protein
VLARRLLSRLILPPGARPVRMRRPPPLLRRPQIFYGGTHQADVHRLFALSVPLTAAQGFLMAHRPAGMHLSADGRLTGASGTEMLTVSYQPHSLPAGIDSAELSAGVVPAPGGRSLLRADAAVSWYPPRSAAEHIDPARYRKAVVTITMLNPELHTVTRAITAPGVITRLAGLANGLHAAPYQPVSCPAIVASFRITFVPAARSAPQAVLTPSGCITVGVTVAGTAQPPLWDGTGLIGAAKRLLHVRSLV